MKRKLPKSIVVAAILPVLAASATLLPPEWRSMVKEIDVLNGRPQSASTTGGKQLSTPAHIGAAAQTQTDAAQEPAHAADKVTMYGLLRTNSDYCSPYLASFSITGDFNLTTLIPSTVQYFDNIRGGVYALDAHYYSCSGSKIYEFDPENWDAGVISSTDINLSNIGFPVALTYDKTTGTAYGCFVEDNNSYTAKYVLATLDLKTGEATKLSALQGAALGMAADSQGDIYAVINVSAGGWYDPSTPTFMKLDKSTDGNHATIAVIDNYILNLQTNVGNNCAVFDMKTDTMYWFASSWNGGKVYTVDPATGTFTKLLETPNGEQFTSLYIPYLIVDDAAPALLTDLDVRFKDAEGSADVSFTMPATTYKGDAISGNIDYTITVGNTGLASGTKSAGERVEVPVTVAERGEITITVTLRVSGHEEESPNEFPTYAGSDSPAAPTDVTVTATGNNLTLTWAEPTIGSHGGFIDSSDLTYRIALSPIDEIITESATGSSFSTVLTLDSPHSLTAEITPVASSITGETAVSGRFIAGPGFEVPYSETFDNADSFLLYTVDNVAGDDATWEYSSGSVGSFVWCGYSQDTNEPKDDWLFTPSIHLEEGMNYVLSFKAMSLRIAFPELLQVKLGQGASVEAMTATLLDTERVNNKESYQWFEYSLPFTVDLTGDYNVGFYALSPADMDHICIDDILIEGSKAGAPGTALDIEIVPAPWGVHNATLKFRTPSQTTDGNTLASLTKAEIYVNNRLFQTEETPETNTFVTVPLITEEGLNTIDIYCFNEEGRSMAARTTVFTGEDAPGVPRNVHAAAADGKVKVTWDVPEGQYGGHVDPDALGYMIVRYDGNETTTLDLDLDECAYIDDFESESQVSLTYIVAAFNDKGTGPGAYSNSIVAGGTPYSLEFAESFPGGLTVYPMWGTQVVDNSGLSRWALYNTREVTGCPDASDGDRGYAAITPIKAGDVTRLFSGVIDMTSARTPVLEFNYRGQYSAGQILVIECNADDEGWTPVAEITLTDSDNDWKRKKIMLSRYNYSDHLQIAFKCKASTTAPVMVDDIRIRDIFADDLAVSLSSKHNMYYGQADDLTVNVANLGMNPAGAYIVNVFKDNRLIEQFEHNGLDVDAIETMTVARNLSLGDADESVYRVVVEYTADDNPDNNKAELSTANHLPLYPAPKDVTGSAGQNGYDFTWNIPDAWTEPEPVAVTDDFESYEPFIIDEIGDWTVIDQDGEDGTFDITGFLMPYRGEPKAFQVMNLYALGFNPDDDETTWQAHSGQQFLVAFCDYDRKNDDWLISPALTGHAQTVSFYAKSLFSTQYGPESYEVLASSTGKELSCFTKIDGGELPDEWTKITADLPEGTRYFAIKCVSYDRYMMGVDDITYIPGSGMPDSFELTGYNFYHNGMRINDNTLPETTFCRTGAENDDYAVTAVYTTGESRFSRARINTTVVNGITDSSNPVVWVDGQHIVVDGAEGKTIAICSADGILRHRTEGIAGHNRFPANRGVYIVTTGGKSVKAIVR